MAPYRLTLVAAALALVAASCSADSGSPARRDEAARSGVDQNSATSDQPTNSPVARACALPAEQLARIWRGYHPRRSEDVLLVPRLPAFFGSITEVNHSGPWDFLQKVPLVFYGPRHLTGAGVVHDEATLADVYPTVGALTGVDLKRRDGRMLSAVAGSGSGSRPKLIVTVVWDGVGRNVLEYWPGVWPTLRRLERKGTSFRNATVASSPSITPATHATLGTGTWPRTHRVTGIYMRSATELELAFEGTDPTDLPVSTWADQIDIALGNRPKVGLLGWSDWHLPMMGHGLAQPSGDRDDVAIVLLGGNVGSNASYFSVPGYLDGFPGLDDRADELDRADGRADGRWMGREILAKTDNPAWVSYQTDMLLAMLGREGYGADTATDLMFVNYKMTDYIGHQDQYESKEMGEVLHAQDAALGRLVRWLDRHVRDYVVIVTADHGHTPNPKRSGGWPIGQTELKNDIDRHFDVPEGSSLVERITAVGIFLDRAVLDEMGASPASVATFVNDYTIGQNDTSSKQESDFRVDEQLFAAAWPGRRLGAVLRCKFGGKLR
jgi:hypothetical protein